MTLMAQAQHFAGPPHWTWFIVPYFFLAGLAGGCYALATLLRFRGERWDEPAARLGFYAAFGAFLPCPVLLTLDLTQPLRFWHMLWNTTPGAQGFNFKYWSPMSLGSWALVVFGLFATVTFVEVLVRDGALRRPLAVRAVRPLDGTLGKLWNLVGAVLGTFVAGYTGVLLAVSNQPVWSDTWALGGLFLASGLSGSAALLLLLSRRQGIESSLGFLEISERLFTALEALLLVVFALTLVDDGTLDEAFGFPWLLLWLVALAGMLPGLRGLVGERLRVTPGGAVAVERVSVWVVSPWLVLVGVLALRAAVIFSAQ